MNNPSGRFRFLALLAAALLPACCAPAHGEVVLTLVAARQHYTEGEPILVGARFVNTGTVDVVLPDPDICNHDLSIEVTDAEGARLRRIKPCEPSAQLPALRLSPGEGHVVLLALAWDFAVPAPGVYHVRAKYDIPDSISVFNFSSGAARLSPSSAFHLQSAEVTFEVGAPTSDRARAALVMLRAPQGGLGGPDAHRAARDFRDVPGAQYVWMQHCLEDITIARRARLQEFLDTAPSSEFAPLIRLALARADMETGDIAQARAQLDRLPADNMLTLDAAAALRRVATERGQ